MVAMTRFLLSHSHRESECETAFAAWADVNSPLRGEVAAAGCAHGDHRVFWWAEAADAEAALALLPDYVAARTLAIPVRDVVTP